MLLEQTTENSQWFKTQKRIFTLLLHAQCGLVRAPGSVLSSVLALKEVPFQGLWSLNEEKWMLQTALYACVQKGHVTLPSYFTAKVHFMATQTQEGSKENLPVCLDKKKYLVDKHF